MAEDVVRRGRARARATDACARARASRGTAEPSPPSRRPSAPARVRCRGSPAVAARRRAGTHPVLEPLLRTVRADPPQGRRRGPRAGLRAWPRSCHRGQLRKSGDPYITHPLAVATILAELGMTPPTLAAALLHDTVEDTDYSLDALRADFGDEVADARRRRHQARQGEVRRGRRRPRPSARWSSRWRATSGCWSSSSPTGCTTCARCAAMPPDEAGAEGARDPRDLRAARAPARHEHASSGSSRTSRSRPSTRSCTTRSCGSSAERAPERDDYLGEVIDAGRGRPARARRSRPPSPAGRSTTTPSTRR